jgi:hypothetical protein
MTCDCSTCDGSGEVYVQHRCTQKGKITAGPLPCPACWDPRCHPCSDPEHRHSRAVYMRNRREQFNTMLSSAEFAILGTTLGPVRIQLIIESTEQL